MLAYYERNIAWGEMLGVAVIQSKILEISLHQSRGNQQDQ
jgi:hypothetical protein